ncbi:hypothetical protein [Lacisediminihabitans profunda]|uniref:Uncharacterized protein n=1 Tax=Lacisediminihabitans profunda TaxID=2594790 RepID=A0A5C8UT31_9MICO|nr:hypothetical protein [Lacisediminihabitans profunda]TXN31050.1 hypothetical protein FVP33_05490 [Lacisediminihabitans profunda]
MKAWRTALVILGVLLTVYGAYLMLDTVKPVKIAGVALWFLAALVLHDGIVAPIVFGVSVALRKLGRSMPVAVLVIIQAGLVVASVFAIIVLPAVYKKTLGTKNPTVLPFDYGTRLVIVWLVVAAVTAVAIATYLAIAKRQKARPSISQA